MRASFSMLEGHKNGQVKLLIPITAMSTSRLITTDVTNFKRAKGAVLIYDTYGIHRAKPVMNSTFVRKSLFFQVDSKMDSAEPILLNSAFIHSSDSKTMAYL